MNNIRNLCLIVSVFIMSFLVGYYVLSWTGPTGTAPASNASAPINVSATQQTKAGRLDAASFYDADEVSYYVNPSGQSVFVGPVGIGTTNPEVLAHIKGGTGGLPITSGTSWTSIFRVQASSNSVMDFGNKNTDTYAGWIQMTDRNAGGSVTYPLLLNPNGGNVGIGTTAPNANAILDITSATKAFLPPRMTTVQRDAIASPVAGMVIYNTTTNVLNFYNGSAWGAV